MTMAKNVLRVLTDAIQRVRDDRGRDSKPAGVAFDGALDDVTYGIEAEFTVLVPPTELDRLDADIAATSSGTLTPRRGADRVVDLPG